MLKNESRRKDSDKMANIGIAFATNRTLVSQAFCNAFNLICEKIGARCALR